jgi:hypothetical protein
MSSPTPSKPSATSWPTRSGLMSDPLRQIILTPAQMEALAAGFQRVGRAAQQVADSMVEAFAAAARRLELERYERAQPRREAQWHLQQEKNILRQQLDRDTTYFGRKRRARRAKGRRIKARKNPPYVDGRIWLASAWAADHRLDALAYGLAAHQQLLVHGVMSQREARATFLELLQWQEKSSD